MGVHFVYRSHYDGPLSKRRRVFDDPTVVAWFARALRESSAAPGGPRAWAEAELGGSVYGFSSLLDAAKEHGLTAPSTWEELSALLGAHLYAEGEIVTTPHTVRVHTNDDEVEVPYFFFDDAFAAAHPDRVAWLLQDDPILPEGGVDGAFVAPISCTAIGARPGGVGATYACLLTFYDSGSVPGEGPRVFPGVRLDELVAHLTRVEPGAEPWPLELRVLRAMISASTPSLSDALAASARFAVDFIGSNVLHRTLGTGPHAEARAELEKAAKTHAHGGDRARDLLSVGGHRAELLLHAHDHFGYQQWLFFDDRWAAAHPALASSLLRYAARWDPLDVEDDAAVH